LIGSVGLREASVLDQDGRPLRLTWNYTRAEIIADGVIHAIGVSLGLAGAVVLVLLTIHAAGGVQTASALIYAIGLVALLGFSAAYNMWPVSRWKWLLRRFDHSAIYLLIAATYTPFLLQMKTDAISIGLLAGIWATALAGIAQRHAGKRWPCTPHILKMTQHKRPNRCGRPRRNYRAMEDEGGAARLTESGRSHAMFIVSSSQAIGSSHRR
jgi:Haemolysin-III related